MAKSYGINGTPWHVERVHNNNPDDGRRHRSRCVFYDPKEKYCSKQVGDCYGASHCKYYKEGSRDLITTDTASFETVSYEKTVAVSFFPEKAQDGTAENQIRIGDMVQIASGRYMIMGAELDEKRHHVYLCVSAVLQGIKPVAEKWIHIYSDWYLTDKEPVKYHANQFWSVQHLSPDVVNRVKSKYTVRGIPKNTTKHMITVRVTGTQTENYILNPYTGKFSRPAGIRVENMHLPVRTTGKQKNLPVKVDRTNKTIYIDYALLMKYLDNILMQKRFELSV